MSLSRTITHSNPKLSVLRSTSPPDERAAALTSDSTSVSTRSKSPDESDLYVTAPAPAGFRPSSVWSVTQAVVSAKSESSFGPFSFFLPKRTSVRPKLRNRAAHFPRDLGERREALLERGVIHEELGGRRLDLRRDDEERVHPLDLAQVAVRDQRHLRGDLLQRAHQVLRRPADQRRAAVGRVFAVARDRPDQDVADEIDDDRDGEDDQPDGGSIVVVVPVAAAEAAAPHAGVEAEAGE